MLKDPNADVIIIDPEREAKFTCKITRWRSNKNIGYKRKQYQCYGHE